MGQADTTQHVLMQMDELVDAINTVGHVLSDSSLRADRDRMKRRLIYEPLSLLPLTVPCASRSRYSASSMRARSRKTWRV